MRRHWQLLKRLIASEDGPTAVEYAVLLALILLICVGAIQTFGTATGDSLRNSANSISNETAS